MFARINRNIKNQNKITLFVLIFTSIDNHFQMIFSTLFYFRKLILLGRVPHIETRLETIFGSEATL